MVNLKMVVSVIMLLLAGCGCRTPKPQVPPFPPTWDSNALSAQVLMRQTVQVYQTLHLQDGEKTYWTGTGVVVRNMNGRSLILTAGHVVHVPDMGSQPDSIIELPVVSSEMYIYDVVNGGCSGVTVAESDKPDLGLIEAECVVGDPVTFDVSSPPVGASVLDVSQAMSFHPDLAYILVDGRYCGDYRNGDSIYSLPIASGASGSGVFYRGKLVGIAVTVNTEFNHMSGVISIERVKKFLIDHPWSFSPPPLLEAPDGG